EESKRAGDNDVAAEAVPSESAEKKCAEIFHDLDARQRGRRDPGLDDSAELYFRSIDDSNSPSWGADIRRIQERPHHPLQSVALDERVGIHRANELAAREAESNVQRVRLATVLLIDDDERRIRRRAVYGAHRFRAYALFVNRLH